MGGRAGGVPHDITAWCLLSNHQGWKSHIPSFHNTTALICQHMTANLHKQVRPGSDGLSDLNPGADTPRTPVLMQRGRALQKVFCQFLSPGFRKVNQQSQRLALLNLSRCQKQQFLLVPVGFMFVCLHILLSSSHRCEARGRQHGRETFNNRSNPPSHSKILVD